MRTQTPLLAGLLLAAALIGDLICLAGAADDEDVYDFDSVGEEAIESSVGAGGGGLLDTENEQKRRMKACFAFTVRRAKARGVMLEEMVGEMLENPARGAEVTQEKALSTIIFSWMMTCYMNIPEERIQTASSLVAEALAEDAEQQVFVPSGKSEDNILASAAAKSLEDNNGEVIQELLSASKSISGFVSEHALGEPTAESKRQWQLLEKVLTKDEGGQDQERRASKQQQSTSYQSTSYNRKKPQQELEETYSPGVLAVASILAVLAIYCFTKFCCAKADAPKTKKERQEERRAEKKGNKRS